MKTLKAVFSIVPDCHAQSGHYRQLWRNHFYDGLRGVVEKLLIPENVDFDWARKWQALDLNTTPAEQGPTSQQLWEQIQRAHRQRGLDAVISYCYSHDVAGSLVKDVIGLGVPWINFFCDSTHAFGRVESLARTVSLNWFPEQRAIGFYQALGVPYFCQPYAVNPACMPDLGCRRITHPLVFIGVPTANRITQLGWLKLFGCPAVIRGHGWIGPNDHPFSSSEPMARRLLKLLAQRNWLEKGLRRLFWPSVRSLARGPLAEQEFADFLRESQMVLGLNQGRDERGRLESYLKFRDIEFPGYGCCYITEHNGDVVRAFESGKEVLTYRNLRAAAALIRRLRSEPNEAREIGQAGRKRVLECHTWSVRLRQLADQL